jgi:hypothetical protein
VLPQAHGEGQKDFPGARLAKRKTNCFKKLAQWFFFFPLSLYLGASPSLTKGGLGGSLSPFPCFLFGYGS